MLRPNNDEIASELFFDKGSSSSIGIANMSTAAPATLADVIRDAAVTYAVMTQEIKIVSPQIVRQRIFLPLRGLPIEYHLPTEPVPLPNLYTLH